MPSNLLVIGIFTYIACLLYFRDCFYSYGLEFFAKRKLLKIGQKLEDLEFSFEQIYYLVATPSTNCDFCKLNLEDFIVEKGKVSFFHGEIYDLKVYAQMPDGQKKLVAIVPKDKFPVPILDTMLYYNQINQSDYEMLVSYLFSHPRTHRMIIEEIRKRVIEGN
ncbi:hypothetical protein [Orenia metallireducens]|nr:hypothetical protein [Orenia metallireducens]